MLLEQWTCVYVVQTVLNGRCDLWKQPVRTAWYPCLYNQKLQVQSVQSIGSLSLLFWAHLWCHPKRPQPLPLEATLTAKEVVPVQPRGIFECKGFTNHW